MSKSKVKGKHKNTSWFEDRLDRFNALADTNPARHKFAVLGIIAGIIGTIVGVGRLVGWLANL